MLLVVRLRFDIVEKKSKSQDLTTILLGLMLLRWAFESVVSTTGQ